MGTESVPVVTFFSNPYPLRSRTIISQTVTYLLRFRTLFSKHFRSRYVPVVAFVENNRYPYPTLLRSRTSYSQISVLWTQEISIKKREHQIKYDELLE